MNRNDFLKLGLVTPLLAACGKAPTPELPEPEPASIDKLRFAGGGYLYTEGGALKYMGASGTVTTLGVA